jgi:hypothetical protein
VFVDRVHRNPDARAVPRDPGRLLGDVGNARLRCSISVSRDVSVRL